MEIFISKNNSEIQLVKNLKMGFRFREMSMNKKF